MLAVCRCGVIRERETKERGRPEMTGVGKKLAQGEPPTAPQTKAGWT